MGGREHKQVSESCKQRGCCRLVHGIKGRLVEWVLWSMRSLGLCVWEAGRGGYRWSHDCGMMQPCELVAKCPNPIFCLCECCDIQNLKYWFKYHSFSAILSLNSHWTGDSCITLYINHFCICDITKKSLCISILYILHYQFHLLCIFRRLLSIKRVLLQEKSFSISWDEAIKSNRCSFLKNTF